MDVPAVLRAARAAADLSQAALAERTSTSQATISAYENGRKAPALETLERLLLATGTRLTIEAAPPPVTLPTAAERRRRGRILAEVIELAEALPARRPGELRYPRLRSKAA